MDQSDLDKAYSCAKTADAATLSGDFSRASRAHVEAANLFHQVASSSPENPAVAVLNALAHQHRNRAAYLSSGKAKQQQLQLQAQLQTQPLPHSPSSHSPITSPMASVREAAALSHEPIEELVGRYASSIFKNLDGLLTTREPNDSFYMVDFTDVSAVRRGAKAMVKQELGSLVKDLREREQRMQDQYEAMRRRR